MILANLPFKASLVSSGDRIFARNDEYFYSIGADEGPSTVVKHPSSDSELIVPPVNFDFDLDKGTRKRYARFISSTKQELTDILTKPYLPVITDQQRQESLEIVSENFSSFEQLKEQRSQAVWLNLQGKLAPKAFQTRMNEIQQQTLKLQRKIRRQILDLLSSDQKKDLRKNR